MNSAHIGSAGAWTGAPVITLAGMSFHVLVGVLAHEAEHPQPLMIDLEVSLTDANAFVDYRELYDVVRRVAEQGPHRLLEDIGGTILNGVLAVDHVRMARVRVQKPGVALPGPLRYAMVTLERTRD